MAGEGHQRLLILSLACVAFLIQFSLGGLTPIPRDETARGWWDSCAGERPPMGSPEQLYDILLQRIHIVASLSAVALLLFLSRRRSTPLLAPDWALVVDFIFAALWFMATYLICVWLKDYLDDSICSTKPNSVSGHVCMHVFAAFALLFVGKERAVLCRLSGVLYTGAFLTVCLCSLAVLQRTFLSGYHSPRQMILGALLGLAITPRSASTRMHHSGLDQPSSTSIG